jgi:hypothetical protein
MFARAILSFLSACRERSRRVPLPTSNQNYLSPNIPTRLSRAPFERDTRPSRKSNHSRTSAIPGRGGICRFSCRTNSSRSFPRNPALCPLSFQSLAHSFIFRSTPISCLPNAFRTLAPKTGGTPLWSCQSYYSPPTNAPLRGFFLYLIYFLYLLYLLYLRYQLPEFAHQLQPATHPLLPTEVTPQ